VKNSDQGERFFFDRRVLRRATFDRLHYRRIIALARLEGSCCVFPAAGRFNSSERLCREVGLIGWGGGER